MSSITHMDFPSLWSHFFPSIFRWVLGVELKTPGLHKKCLYSTEPYCWSMTPCHNNIYQRIGKGKVEVYSILLVGKL